MSQVKLLFGAGGIGEGAISHTWTTLETTNELLTSLQELGLSQLDSAASYPPGAPWVTETLLGQSKAAEKGFLIDSKIIPYSDAHPWSNDEVHAPGSLTEVNIDASLKKTFELLGIESLNVLYVHFPDTLTPVEESARAFDKHFKAGHFKQLGLCNYSTSEMKEWLDVCREKGYVPPTIYQGNYNIVGRHDESTLYPLLREHGIKINAYGPLAGGFLTGKVSLQTPETNLTGTRWGPGGHPLYPSTFDKPLIHTAMRSFCKACENAGITSTEASLRWLMNHSALEEGDGIILGASRIDQLTRSVKFCKKGPLDEKILGAIQEVWDSVKEETVWRM